MTGRAWPWTKEDAAAAVRAAHRVGKDFPVSGIDKEVEDRIAAALLKERLENAEASFASRPVSVGLKEYNRRG